MVDELRIARYRLRIEGPLVRALVEREHRDPERGVVVDLAARRARGGFSEQGFTAGAEDELTDAVSRIGDTRRRLGAEPLVAVIVAVQQFELSVIRCQWRVKSTE
jgi:hypothetical protein